MLLNISYATSSRRYLFQMGLRNRLVFNCRDRCAGEIGRVWGPQAQQLRFLREGRRRGQEARAQAQREAQRCEPFQRTPHR